MTGTDSWCLVCAQRGTQRRATAGYRTCTRCCERLRDMLSEITSRHLTLCTVAALLPTTGEEGRKASGFASTSPARDRVIAMLDSRTVALLPGDPHSVFGVVSAWASLVREETNQAPPADPPTVRSEAGVLDAWMDWITKQDWVPDLHTELREVRDQLRAETGEPNPKPIGHCINTLDDGETTRECQAPLFAPKEGTALRCHHCGREYDGLDLVKLELAQEAS